MPQKTIDLLQKGIKAGNADAFRRGNVIHLPAAGSLISTGDLHGHRRNFERIVNFADLKYNPDRHVILQEIIHGGPEDHQGGCLSYQLLFDVVRYKIRFPDHVHIIMGNHDTAFISDIRVMKAGKEMSSSMESALERQFEQASPDIKSAIKQFLLSLPLAVRSENRIWMSHSLPGDRLADEFDPKVLERQLLLEDCEKPGSAYLLTWGRNHSQDLLQKMAKLLNVDTFILGHQPQNQGWNQAGKNLIIIASDHNHGCLLPINLTKSYTVEQLIDSIIQLNSIT